MDAKALPGWRWKWRRVSPFDGTTVTMPYTPANQAAYPQVYNQGPGVGFPIARLGSLISLACGAVVGLGFARYAGKGQGEVSVLRRIRGVLAPGDVILADRLNANWVNVVFLRERGLELASRLNKANRTADFRRGRRLGPDDHLVDWPEPTSIRSLDRKADRASRTTTGSQHPASFVAALTSKKTPSANLSVKPTTPSVEREWTGVCLRRRPHMALQRPPGFDLRQQCDQQREARERIR